MVNNSQVKCLFCESKSSCFKELTNDELEKAGKGKLEVKYKKGEIIAKQGTFATNIQFLKKGLVKLYLETDTGNNVNINFIPEGNLIGLPSLYGNSFKYSVSAVTECIVCAIDINTFREMILTNGKFAEEVINTLNSCTQYTYDKLISLTQKQLNGRLADAFLHFSNNVFQSKKFKLEIPRKDLADFTGMSVMSVVRVLKELRKDGIIKEDNGSVEILDEEKLVQISRNG